MKIEIVNFIVTNLKHQNPPIKQKSLKQSILLNNTMKLSNISHCLIIVNDFNKISNRKMFLTYVEPKSLP